ncbi:MAG: penicillin-binding protein 2 [Candidatus Moranbacteria bacterium]|nr:penicillin-binding protein 2 [Candidatus Moranbacteria bacterium]
MANVQRGKKYGIGARCSLAEKIRNPRINVLGLLVIVIACVVIFRAYFLQVNSYGYYSALAENQHSLFRKLIPERGEIYLKDRDALYPVAVNKETKMAYAVPKEIEDASAASEKIAAILNLDKTDLEGKLSKKDDMYEVLKHRLSEDEIGKIENAKLAGVHLSDEAFRYYPAGELASHVLGFVGWKDNDFGGRYGSELFFDGELKGENGKLFQNKDASGRWIATGDRDITYAKNGDNLVLTIDHIVQYETEKILAAAVAKYQAERGSIIVMESKTGKIISMASYPTFNPNEYAKVENMEAFRNLAVSDPYECGSVFKSITLASAIDAGKITPDMTYVDSGAVTEAGYTIKNSDLKANGKQTMTQVLEKSLNTGVIFAEKLMGNQTFSDYVKKFGFGTLTGADIFAEVPGNLSNFDNYKRNIEFFTASFGQGITVTPLQLISAYNAIANNGVLLKPQIVDQIIHSDGSVTETSATEVRRVISERSAYEITQMLRGVVTDGHGKQANVPGFLVGGKTGTAQVVGPSGGYEDGKSIGSFAGFAPIDNPRFTMLVRLDDPKTVQWAESSAAPTFGELMKFLLEYYHVEPTESYTQADVDKFNQTHTLGNSFLKTDNPEDVKVPAAAPVISTDVNSAFNKKDGQKTKKK